MKIEGGYWITDIGLAREGLTMIEAAKQDMPAVVTLVKEFKESQPLRGDRIATCVIPTAQTGVLAWAIKELGGAVQVCSDNVISTDDRVAAAIVENYGIPVFARRDQTREQFVDCIRRTVEFRQSDYTFLYPTRIIDDGADMTLWGHRNNNADWLSGVRLISEQTTCGVEFDKRLAEQGKLIPPVIDINTGLKQSFDNRYGPRESFLPAFKACVGETQLGGKLAVVCGYGMVGKGVIEVLRMAGCQVMVTEASAVRATEALMNGIPTVRMEQVAQDADIIITAATGPEVVTENQLVGLKPGAMICNMGENQQYPAHQLVNKGWTREQVNPNLVRYRSPDGTRYFDSLLDGWLLNMRLGGNPSRVLGITFALQLYAHILDSTGQISPIKGRVQRPPAWVDEKVALWNTPGLETKITIPNDCQNSLNGRGLSDGDYE